MSTRSTYALRCEELESRVLLSFTAQDQLLLELINQARANPQAEATRLLGGNLNLNLDPGTISTAAKQPLVLNANLQAAAQQHTDRMLGLDFFAHLDPYNGTSPGQRADIAGYPWNLIGENIAFEASTVPTMPPYQVSLLHDGLFESAGHRLNILNPNFREIGVSVELGQYIHNGIPYDHTTMGTELFGTIYSNGPFLTGVVIADLDADLFYDVGEGLPNVTITAIGASGTFSTTTLDTGGYQLGLPTGTYTVNVSGPGVIDQFTVTIGNENVKKDVVVDAGGGSGGGSGTVDLEGFTEQDDFIRAGAISLPGNTDRAIFINRDQSPGNWSYLIIDPLDKRELVRKSTAEVSFAGLTDPSDRIHTGDVDGDGISELIFFNRPEVSGGKLNDPAIVIVDPVSGQIQRSIQYTTFNGQTTLGQALFGMVDPEDEVFVGHFTRQDHLEAVYFNRTAETPGSTAFQVVDLVTGQITFTSLHDGNIFGGWLDSTDEYIVSDTNFDGYDDLVFYNRVPNPEVFRNTNKGFVGMISIKDVGGPAGPYRGFYRFFDWNFALPGENNVFPGYDEIGDHAVAGTVWNNGGFKPVMLLVNSSSNQQAAYAVLEPREKVEGQRDSFRLITTVFHNEHNVGSFDADDTFLMADTDGNGMDEVISYSRGSGGTHLRVFETLPGNARSEVRSTAGWSALRAVEAGGALHPVDSWASELGNIMIAESKTEANFGTFDVDTGESSAFDLNESEAPGLEVQNSLEMGELDWDSMDEIFESESLLDNMIKELI